MANLVRTGHWIPLLSVLFFIGCASLPQDDSRVASLERRVRVLETEVKDQGAAIKELVDASKTNSEGIKKLSASAVDLGNASVETTNSLRKVFDYCRENVRSR